MTRRLALLLLLAFAAPPPAGAAPAKPGKVLFERNGVIQRSSLRVTQDAFRVVNNCAGTQLNGVETNGISAAILDISKYQGQHISITLTEEIALGGFYYMTFYSADCQLLNTPDGAWPVSTISKASAGPIPSRAVWLLLGRGNSTTHYGGIQGYFSAPGQMAWKVTIRALPRPAGPPRNAKCKQITDPAGDDAEPQLDILSADIAVDRTAVTVGIRVKTIDYNIPSVPFRSYVVEFTMPDGKTLFLGVAQSSPHWHAVGDGSETAFRQFGGTKDASGYHDASLSTQVTRAWVDTRTGELRVTAYFAKATNGASISSLARFDRGKKLTNVTVRTMDGPVAGLGSELRKDRDVAQAKAPYVIGTTTCLQPVVD